MVGVGAEEALRDDGDGLDSAVDVRLEPYGDAVPAGEGGDHVQADAAVLEQVGDVDLVGVGEQGVHLRLLRLRHAEAPVLDLDGEAGGDVLGAQQHGRVGGGEEGGVLDEFGEEVDHVGDGVAAQRALDGRDELDAGVLLHLRDGGAEHLGQGDRVRPLAAGHGAAEDRQVLRVAAGAGGQVVDVEEALEQVGVLHLVLQLVEELDLAVHEGLESACEVGEDLGLLLVADAAGEPGRLDGGGDGGVVGAAELVGQQVEGVAAGGGRRGAPYGGAFAAAQLLDGGVQVLLSAGGGAAQGVAAVQDGAGGAVGAERRGDDGAHDDGGGAGQGDPQRGRRPGVR